ncbi:MAG: hypothetical protein ABIR24_04745 [Verrucomicrobiota bacterium]
MTPTCPQCKRAIPDVDVNVGTDVAFCRACHVAHKLSSLVHGVQLDNPDLGHPPSGAWHRGSGMGTVIGATHRSIGLALGALAISLFWNGIVSIFVLLAISATLQHLDVPTPDWFPAPKMNGGAMSVGMTIFLWIFLTPFILVGSIMIGTFLSAFAGRTEVEIRQSEGTIFVGIGPLGWRRRFNSATVKDVRIEDRSWRDSDGDRRNKRQIIIECEDGKEIKFGSMLREDRMKFVAAAVRRALLN